MTGERVRTLGAWSSTSVDHAATGLDVILERNPVARISDVQLKVTDQHANYFDDQRTVYLAECRVLVLTDPNPFPPLRLFRWLP